ncbi:MAG: sodium:solute symporter family protein [Porticoccaceae bacterium]
MTPLLVWSWVFLILYIGLMLGLGYMGMRRVTGSDDFSTARNGYGMWFLGLAMTATTASGATFLGIPGLGYIYGLPAVGYALVYPFAVYLGIWFCFKQVQRTGHHFGNRSIPEFIGDRYQSDLLRIVVAVFSLVLLFYLAAQLLAGLVMFQQLLGLDAGWALGMTAAVLLVYVVLGGAHADILTDGIQGAMMLVLAAVIIGLFAFGVGVPGGFGGVLDRLAALDPHTVKLFYPGSSLFDSWWDLSAIFLAHVSLGMLPHIGNKIWALREGVGHTRFMLLCLVFGLVLSAMILGGLLARAVLGDRLLTAPGDPNQAIPVLLIEVFPAWLAALFGAGILAAIMSTADGLVISISQVFANDIYRRGLVRLLHPQATPEQVDRNVLRISRWGVVVVMIGAAWLAWVSIGQNIALMVWVGLGGLMAALVGPLILGVFWRGVTRQGALWGFIAGALAFTVLRQAWLPGGAVDGNPLAQALFWVAGQANNPFACTTLAEAFCILVTAGVSLVTGPLPQAHLDRIFGVHSRVPGLADNRSA